MSKFITPLAGPISPEQKSLHQTLTPRLHPKCMRTAGSEIMITNRFVENSLILLELSVIVFGLFGSISGSASMQTVCSGRPVISSECIWSVSNAGTTITTSPHPSCWIELLPTYWGGIELNQERHRKCCTLIYLTIEHHVEASEYDWNVSRKLETTN